MVHVFLVADPTLAYCGCGGWVSDIPFPCESDIASIEWLARKWHTEHWLKEFQPGKDSTVGGENADT